MITIPKICWRATEDPYTIQKDIFKSWRNLVRGLKIISVRSGFSQEDSDGHMSADNDHGVFQINVHECT